MLFWWLSLFLRRSQQNSQRCYFAWENHHDIFVMFPCCWSCFPQWRFLCFRAIFSLPPTLHPGFSGPWRPPPSLSSNLATFVCLTFARLFCHSFTASATVLSRHFLVTGVHLFTLRSFTDIFGTIFDPDAGRNTPSRILLCSCPLRVVPSGWRMGLNTHIVVTRPWIYQLRQ